MVLLFSLRSLLLECGSSWMNYLEITCMEVGSKEERAQKSTEKEEQ